MLRVRVAASVWFAAGAMLCVGASSAQTFPGSTVNTAGNSLIPSVGTGGCSVAPQTTGGTIFNNTVAGLGAGVGVGSMQINLTHTFDSDLDIYLVAPNLQILELTSDNGGAGDNFTNTVFQDGAPYITTGTPPYTGTFAPEGTLVASACGTTVTSNITTLAAFIPGQNGVWQLVIKDDVGADTGTMLSWSITFGCVINCPANQNLGTDPGECAALVNYQVTANPACGTVIQTSGLPSGSDFPVGTVTNCYGTTAGPSCCFDVTVSDDEAPLITCPADIALGLPPYSSGQNVDYPPPTVSDNCPGVGAPSCVPASGDLFPAGNTVVLCDVIDAAANLNSCNFNVDLREVSVLEVPTASTWGLAALALLLAGAALVLMRRQG